MDEILPGFRPCLTCTRFCYKEHWPFPSRDSFRAPCFVKALCDSNLATMATCWMVIPSAWLKLYGDDVGNSAILLGPSGNSWQVGVSRPKWVAFRVGWRTFAADNCLEKGDMLVFTLIGKSKFSVKIFDSRTCLEKESSLTATNTGCYDSRSPILLGEKRKQRDCCETAELKRICTNDNDEMKSGISDQALESLRIGNGLQQSLTKISIFSAAALVSQRKCSLLDLNSKPLNIHHNASNDGATSLPELNQQLLDAVDARTLQECASSVVYQPHPISISSHDHEEECSRHGQFKEQECGPGGIGPATRFAAQRRPVMDVTRERHSENQCRQNSSSAVITSVPSSQALVMNREHFAQGCGPEILSPAVILERVKALELARRAQDAIDRPSHLVVLRAFHVHGRAFVRFPVTFGKQHMPRKTAPMHLLDSNGHLWPMTWLRDNETHMGLTRGWRDFCLAEGLLEGDVCIFELIEFNKLTLFIHVFRSTETRGSTQVIITRSKRLDLSPPGHIHKKHFEKRKISEDEGCRQRKDMFFDDKDQQPNISDEQFRIMPTSLVFYNPFHRAALPSSVKPNEGCGIREGSTAGSVGRERLKQLSLLSSKSQDRECLSTVYNREFDSEEGRKLKTCSKNNIELNDGDMRKAQATTYGKILCQMSSGYGNAATNNAKAPANSTPTSAWIGLTENDGKVSSLQEHEIKGRHSHGFDRRRSHGYANTSKSPDRRLGVIRGRNIHKMWAKTWNQCRKAGKSKKSDWTWSTTSRATKCSALKRTGPAANRKPRFYIASRRSSVSYLQKEAAKVAALALSTANPSTLVVMKSSNVYNTYSVGLPVSFSRQLSSGERIRILLSDAAGHETKACLTDSIITKGWRQFSLEHLLEEGDVCVFELIDILHQTVMVHIFRVVDVDHLNDTFQNHYRIISLGMPRRPVNDNRKTQFCGQAVKNTATTRICQHPRNNVKKSLYLALRNTRAKRTAIKENEWLYCGKPLDLNLNIDLANVSPPVSNASIGSPNRTTSTSCAWDTISIHSLEMDREPLDSEEPGYAHQRLTSSGNSYDVSGTSASRRSIPNDVYENTSSKARQQIVPQEREKMLMRLPGNREDSEAEEEHYYRVVRIHKKRYCSNEKQYLTELDGPVMQSTACEGIRDHNDMKWWIPEKSFSSGFASCYLR